MSQMMNVVLSVDSAMNLIEKAIIEGSFTGQKIGGYILPCGDKKCEVAVFEKHYYRAGNRLTLTVTVDDFGSYTRVALTGGGGGEGLFRFDWGASDNFENTVTEALSEYIVNR